MRKKVLYRPVNSSCSPITALAIDPKGKRIACGMLNANIVLLSQKTGKPIRALTGHESMISGLSFVNEGKRLISSSWDCTTRHWTSSNGIQGESTLSHKTEFKTLSIDSTGSKGAVGARDGLVKIFSAKGLTTIRNVPAHSKDISGLAFTSDCSHMITTSWDGIAKLWDISCYETVKNLGKFGERIRSIAIAPDDSRVFLGMHNGLICSININNVRDKSTLEGHRDIVSALSVNSSGDFLISGSHDRTVRLWSLEKEKTKSVERLSTNVSALEWTVKNDSFYSADYSGSLIQLYLED